MKKIALLISLILLATSVLANSYSGTAPEYGVQMDLPAGWSLVPVSNFMDINSEHEAQRNGVRASFLFDNEEKSYIELYPNRDEAAFDRLGDRFEHIEDEFDELEERYRTTHEEEFFSNEYFYEPVARFGTIMNGAAWVYSERAQSITTDVEAIVRYNKFYLTPGWNIITATPDMVEENLGRTLYDMNTHCPISRAYFFRDNRWEDARSVTFTRDMVWTGIAIHVAQRCTFHAPNYEPVLTPPSLPGMPQPVHPREEVEVRPIERSSEISGQFPEEIGGYELVSESRESDCDPTPSGEQVCFEGTRLEYQRGSEGVYVLLTRITNGISDEDYFQLLAEHVGPSTQNVFGEEILTIGHEFLWPTNEDFDLVVAEEVTPVTQWFLNEFPVDRSLVREIAEYQREHPREHYTEREAVHEEEAVLESEYPANIGGYELVSERGEMEDCDPTPTGTEICFEGTRLEYRTGNTGVFVSLTRIGGAGAEEYFDLIGQYLIRAETEHMFGQEVIRPEPHEFLWPTTHSFDVITFQEFTAIPRSNGESYDYGRATGTPVMEWFINEFPVDNNRIQQIMAQRNIETSTSHSSSSSGGGGGSGGSGGSYTGLEQEYLILEDVGAFEFVRVTDDGDEEQEEGYEFVVYSAEYFLEESSRPIRATVAVFDGEQQAEEFTQRIVQDESGRCQISQGEDQGTTINILHCEHHINAIWNHRDKIIVIEHGLISNDDLIDAYLDRYN